MSSSERESRKLLRCKEGSYCEGFRMPAATDDVRLVLAAGVRKPPREETAGEGLERYGLRYGDLSAAGEVVGCTRGGRGER